MRGSTLGDDSEAEGAAPAQGLFGGHDGGLNTLRLTLPDGSVATGAAEGGRDPDGDGLRLIDGGGAGYSAIRRYRGLAVDEVRKGC